jgi:putative oxidoreductase
MLESNSAQRDWNFKKISKIRYQSLINKISMITNVKKLAQKLLTTHPLSSDLGLLILRFMCGLMLLHGWSKFINYSEEIKDFPDPFHVGITLSYSFTVFAELFCSLFILLGLFTRIALIPLIILMIVIVFIIHSGQSLIDREHAILYLLAYLSLFLTGPGKYSVDYFIKKK